MREKAPARLADQYIGATRLTSALVHPGTLNHEAVSPGQLLAEDVVRGDPWGLFMAERASLVRMVEQAHAAWLQSRTWQLAELLSVMFDWRADWRSWERTHQLALDAARQAGDADAEAGIMRSLGALSRELGRYDEAVTLLTQAAAIFESHGDRQRWAAVLRNLGDACRYQGRLTEAIETFSAGLTVFRSAADTRSQAAALNGMADAHRGLSHWAEAREAFQRSGSGDRDAGPALVGFVLWLQEQVRQRGLRRLRFLSRDGQVLYELTRRLFPGLDLEYIYSSRLTWSLAATQPGRLAEAPWLFNVEARIAAMRGLVLDYASQHHLAEADTGLVDIGWTGRMAASLISVCGAVGMGRPHILFWGHEPRPATGWTDSERVGSYVYNTATGDGLGWRVPDAPFVMETFCMGDHGIVSGYRRDADGQIEPVLLSPRNDAAEAWGFGCTG